jgi:hypothetical protein
MSAIKKYFLFFLLLVTSLHLYCQQWEFGRYRFAIEQGSAPMRITFGGSRGLSSYSMLSRVGGIAFDQVATLPATWQGKAIQILYQGKRVDGNRLTIIAGRDTVRPKLPDWIMIPTAQYADSKHTAVVSLFGERTNERQWDIVFHPAFKNTLLGLRLLHADLFLMDPANFRELPKWNGNTVIGRNEKLPDNAATLSSCLTINSLLSTERYQAYVLTDANTPIAFEVKNAALKSSASPYFYFWKSDQLDYAVRIEPLVNRIHEGTSKNLHVLRIF